MFSWKKVSPKDDDGRLRVAVTIVMPSNSRRKEKGGEEPAAICLGVTDIPLHPLSLPNLER